MNDTADKQAIAAAKEIEPHLDPFFRLNRDALDLVAAIISKHLPESSAGAEYVRGLERAAWQCEERVRTRGQWLLPSEKEVLKEMAMQIRSLVPPAQPQSEFCYAEGDEGSQYCGDPKSMHCPVLGDAITQEHLVKCMREDHFIHHKFVARPESSDSQLVQQLLEAARLALQQCEFIQGRRKRGWDYVFLADKLSAALDSAAAYEQKNQNSGSEAQNQSS